MVVTHWVHEEIAAYLSAFCEPLIPSLEDGIWPPRKVTREAADADGLIACMADRVDDTFLAACPRLRVVSATLKGYDNFDAQACTRRGVWLTIVPDLLTVPTAELAIGLLIGIGRRIAEGDQLVRGGGFAGWRPQLYGSGLDGATVGILGMGQVGRAVAERLRPFGTRLAYCDIRALPGEVASELGAVRLRLPDLLAVSDALVVLLPLTAGTRHLIDAASLGAMRPGARLVNVGRGSAVDEAAVADALYEGRLGGYAADVFAMEDQAQPDHPDQIPARLLRHPRTLFTPHLGSAVDNVRRQMSLAAARQVGQALRGERPDHAVNNPARR